MSVFDVFEEFVQILPKGASIIGLDLGTKTIGVAISDRLWSVATPRETISRKKFTNDWQSIKAISDQVEAGGIILGLPMNMDGSEGPKCQSTRHFAKNFSNIVSLPITFWDERLTTVEAERSLLSADLSRKKRKRVVDSVAAVLILQNLLDRLKYIQHKNT